MKVKEWIALAIAALTLLGMLYAGALKGGWIVNDAKAQEIAQQRVDVEEAARLEFMRETKFSRLKYLNAQPAPTPDEKLEMEILRDEIKKIQDRLADLRSK